MAAFFKSLFIDAYYAAAVSIRATKVKKKNITIMVDLRKSGGRGICFRSSKEF